MQIAKTLLGKLVLLFVTGASFAAETVDLNVPEGFVAETVYTVPNKNSGPGSVSPLTAKDDC